MKKVFAPEKVRELADTLFNNPVDTHTEIITEWLKQNQHSPDLLEALIDTEDMINKSVSGLEKYSVIEWQFLLVKMQKLIGK